MKTQVTKKLKIARQLYVRDLRKHLELRQISPEKLAQDVQLSHMTIRRWLKKADSTPLPRKYDSLLNPILSATDAASGLFNVSGMETLMTEVEKSGENFKDVETLEKDLRSKLKSTRFDKIFIDSCRSLLLAIKSKKTTLRAKAVCVGALLYFISPIDLIPDNIPVVGYLDDLAVLSLALDFIGRSSAQKTPAKIKDIEPVKGSV